MFAFQLAKQDLTLTQLASDLSHQTYSKELFSADVREISNIIQGMLARLEPSVLDHNIGVWHREQLYKDLLQVKTSSRDFRFGRRLLGIGRACGTAFGKNWGFPDLKSSELGSSVSSIRLADSYSPLICCGTVEGRVEPRRWG